MRAVAVERGADATRLVGAGPGGRPEPAAVLPSGTTIAAALDDLAGPLRGTVAVVIPPDGDRDDPPPELDGDVRSVPAPVAVLAGRSGRFLVVDAGRSGTTLTVVDDGCVRSTVRVPVGGDRLDALLTEATGCPADRVRRVREALSFVDRIEPPGHRAIDADTVEATLRPVFEEIVALVPSMVVGVDEVVVTGGLARTPLLAEMLDECAGRPVRVLPEPDLAAVRGALELLRRADGGGAPSTGDMPPAVDRARAAGRSGKVVPVADPADPVSGATDPVGVDSVPAGSDAHAGSGTATRRSRPTRMRNGRLVPAAAVLGLLLVGTGSVLGAADGTPAPPPSGTLVQYGYSIALPAGWEHTGGDPQRRRTLLSRTTSPDGVELISVERSPLGYDSAAEPDRTRAELAAVHVAAGGLGALRPDTVAGRSVTRYRQQAGPDAVVDWYVVFEGADELAVGCRGPIRGPAPELERACAEVVGTVRAVDQPE